MTDFCCSSFSENRRVWNTGDVVEVAFVIALGEKMPLVCGKNENEKTEGEKQMVEIKNISSIQ